MNYACAANAVQVRLRSNKLYLTCWVKDAKGRGIEVGNLITLKDYEDPNLMWEIISINEHSFEIGEINRSWHVGGL